MNKVEELIQQLCPEGVEYKELGDVVVIVKGKQLNKELLTDIGTYPAYNGGISFSGFTDNYNYDENTIIISQGGASAGFVNFITTKFYANAHCYVVLPNNEVVINRYVYHFLKLNQERLTEKQHGAGIPALKTSEIAKLLIPIPPLPVQQEIVTILDTFTQLEAELEAELEARKKQYEYYRNELLTFGDGDDENKSIRYVRLEEVINFMNGKGHEKYIDETGEYIVVNSKFISTDGMVKKYSKTQISPIFKDDILMVMSDLPNGKALAKCFIVDNNNKYTLNQRICALSVKDKNDIYPKFIYYILSRNAQLLRYDNGVDQTNLRKDDILKIQIPIPPLAEQERIVGILDKFDALVNDISIGLPAEIEARRKQYEYYREKLLSFEKAE